MSNNIQRPFRLPDPVAFNDQTAKKTYLQQLIKSITTNVDSLENLIDQSFDDIFLSQYFASTEQAVSHTVTLTIPHGLSTVPVYVRPILRNKTAQLGYTVGQEYSLSNCPQVFTSADTTNIYVYITANIQVPNLSSSYTLTNITEADWKIVVNASA